MATLRFLRSAKRRAEEDPVIDTSPCGNYVKFRELLGRGAAKAVSRGLNIKTGVPVAWCELNSKIRKVDRARFISEAELLNQLQHPNIIRYYSSWQIRTDYGVRMVLLTEFMSGGTINEYRKQFRNLGMDLYKNWCCQILKGLQYLHSRKPAIIHRDLKCENIFVCGATGKLKIGDFGLSIYKQCPFDSAVVGTPEFMAPEVYEERYSEAVDIYAFGMSMLEIMIGDFPYSECSSATQVFNAVRAGIKPIGLNKVTDLRTISIIRWCISRKPSDRPNCAELLFSKYFAQTVADSLLDYNAMRWSSQRISPEPMETEEGRQLSKKKVLFTMGSRPIQTTRASASSGTPPSDTDKPSTSAAAARKHALEKKSRFKVSLVPEPEPDRHESCAHIRGSYRQKKRLVDLGILYGRHYQEEEEMRRKHLNEIGELLKHNKAAHRFEIYSDSCSDESNRSKSPKRGTQRLRRSRRSTATRKKSQEPKGRLFKYETLSHLNVISDQSDSESA